MSLMRETFNPMRRAMAFARKIQGYFGLGQPHLLLCVAEKKLSTRVWPHTRIKSTTKAAATTTAAVEAARRRGRCTCSCLISDTTAAPECMCLLSVAALLSPLSGMRLHY